MPALRVRVGKHSGVSLLTGKTSKSKKSTALKDRNFQRSWNKMKRL